MRFATPQRYTGRLQVLSQSLARYSGQYVHTAVGPALFASTWLEDGELRASRELGLSGNVRVTGVRVYAGMNGFSREFHKNRGGN